MAIYLETNALRKLTNYRCEETAYTSIFSIFELLSGITKENFEVRKACLRRVKEQKIEIRGPMIDKLFGELVGKQEYNNFAYRMILDIYKKTLKSRNYSCINDMKLLINGNIKTGEIIHALTWLRDWDKNIQTITNNLDVIFEDENPTYIKKLYEKSGVIALAKHFWHKYKANKINEERLSHTVPFLDSDTDTDTEKKIRQEVENLFSKYNYKLFMTSQAVVFSKAFFINGNTQNRNNASDLLHLLYLDKDNKFISNDKIYQTIHKACPYFKLVVLNNEKNLSDLICNQ